MATIIVVFGVYIYILDNHTSTLIDECEKTLLRDKRCILIAVPDTEVD